jgi:hypothetical protein
VAWNVEFLVGEIANARREPEPEQMHKSKQMIGETSRISVVLLDSEIRLMIEQAIQYVSGIAHRGMDRLDVIRRILIGKVTVESYPWFTAIFGVDVADRFAVTAGAKALTV